MAFDVDFFVIGAGSGGVRAARVAAGHGARTIVAEESRIGGTCVIRGCVPKKLYVYASRYADDFADAAGFGWTVGEPTFDWPSLIAAKEMEITRLSAAYRAHLAESGAKLIEERAAVVGPQRVRLADGEELSARHILVAVGSRPTFLPGVEGLEHAITSNEIFDLPVFPERLLVIGGGYIAVEFASLFQRLGSQVTQIMRAPTFCAASTTTCARACARRWLAPASFTALAACRAASRRQAAGFASRSPTERRSTSTRRSSRPAGCPTPRGSVWRRRAHAQPPRRNQG